MALKSVCVYCSSSNHIDDKYKQLARNIGVFLAQRDIDLIYGGGNVGMMGETANSCLVAGGKVTGIIPSHLHDKEVQHTGLTELLVVDTMHERKMIMAEKSEGFIVLPGGFGTLDETFEIMTWKQLGLHNKPIIIYNLDGFWDNMIALIKDIVGAKFAPEDNLHMFKEVKNQEELEAALNSPADALANPEKKWE